MLSIEELTKKLNEKGKITDKQTAIELLMLSPDAWKILSSELQEDEEVMLYYQPKRYVETDEGPTYGIYEPESGGILYDNAFEIDGDVTVSSYFSVNIKSVMPKCVIERSNNFKKAYMNVQKKLEYKNVEDGNKITSEGKKRYDELTENMHGIYAAKNRFYGSSDGYVDDYRLYECDLTQLPEIVDEEYKKYLMTKGR